MKTTPRSHFPCRFDDQEVLVIDVYPLVQLNEIFLFCPETADNLFPLQSASALVTNLYFLLVRHGEGFGQ